MKIAENLIVSWYFSFVPCIKISTPRAMGNYSFGQSMLSLVLLEEITFVCFGI